MEVYDQIHRYFIDTLEDPDHECDLDIASILGQVDNALAHQLQPLLDVLCAREALHPIAHAVLSHHVALDTDPPILFFVQHVTPWTDSHTALLEKLLQRGADVQAAYLMDRTPLFFVSHVKAAQLLVQAGANPLQQDRDGNIPLMVALCPALWTLVHKPNPDVVFYLHSFGGLDIRNNEGQCVLELDQDDLAPGFTLHPLAYNPLAAMEEENQLGTIRATEYEFAEADLEADDEFESDSESDDDMDSEVEFVESRQEYHLPPGKYYVGDPTLIITPLDWQAKISRVRHGLWRYQNALFFSIESGFGDGTYDGSDGFQYTLESAIFSVIPASLADLMTSDDVQLKEFTEPLHIHIIDDDVDEHGMIAKNAFTCLTILSGHQNFHIEL